MPISLSQLKSETVGALYTYALLSTVDITTNVTQGSTTAGTLAFSGTYQKAANGIIQNGQRNSYNSGTWRIMGVANYANNIAINNLAGTGSLWVRIA